MNMTEKTDQQSYPKPAVGIDKSKLNSPVVGGRGGTYWELQR